MFAWRAFPARGDASPGAYLAVPALESAGIRIAFTTRHGGFSGDPFSSLNLSFFSGDDPDVVMANRARAMAVIGGDPASWTSGRQVHGAETVRVDGERKGAGADSPETMKMPDPIMEPITIIVASSKPRPRTRLVF